MRSALAAEGIGTGLLLYIVVGSGIAAESIGGASAGLWAHALAVGIGLAILITLFITVSGSHFNPAVTLAMWRTGALGGSQAAGYVVAQLAGAVVGVVVAHLSFELDPVSVSSAGRGGMGRLVAELVGTFVLVAVILVLVRTDRGAVIPLAVGGWVAAIIFSTSSTGFANPAVTIARVLTDTYTGIAPRWVPGFVLAQLAGAVAANFVVDRIVQPQKERV